MAYDTIMMPWHAKQFIIVHMPQHIPEKKRKDYAFWHQFKDKASIIPGCPGACLKQDRVPVAALGTGTQSCR